MRPRQPIPAPAPAETRVINTKVEPVFTPKGLQFRVTMITATGEQVFIFDHQAFAKHTETTAGALEFILTPTMGAVA